MDTGTWIDGGENAYYREMPEGAYDGNAANRYGGGRGGYANRYAWATGAGDDGDGWGNGWEGDSYGGGRRDVERSTPETIRTDPIPDDLRQLVTNTIAFAHLWRL